MMEFLEGRRMLALVGGVDPYNMGKGEWIWQVGAAQTNTQTANPTELANFLKNRGIKWVIIKAGDGNDGPLKDYGTGGTPTAGSWTQFSTSTINIFHNAGIKVFGYHFIYGGGNPAPKVADTTPALERQVQKHHEPQPRRAGDRRRGELRNRAEQGNDRRRVWKAVQAALSDQVSGARAVSVCESAPRVSVRTVQQVGRRGHAADVLEDHLDRADAGEDGRGPG
jgi:hypothetical protein